MIDVDDLVEDPDFAQALTVYRRKYTVGAAYVTGLVTPNPWGAVQSGANADLIRMSDMAITDKYITVYSKFRFLAEGSTFNVNTGVEAKAITDIYGNQILPADALKFKADIIYWHGDPYEVFSIQDWTDYGTGFTSVTCRKISMGEAGLVQDGSYSVNYNVSGLNFTIATNSMYVGLPI